MRSNVEGGQNEKDELHSTKFCEESAYEQESGLFKRSN